MLAAELDALVPADAVSEETESAQVIREAQNASASNVDEEPEQNEQCSICLEILEEAQSAMHCLGSAGRRHHFHGACLAPWVAECQRGSREPTCPNCRGPVAFHRQRLATQLSQEASVQDFIQQHSTQVDALVSEDEEGWVRVRQRPASIMESLQEQFQALDAALLSTRRQVHTPPSHWLQTVRASQPQPDSMQIVPSDARLENLVTERVPRDIVAQDDLATNIEPDAEDPIQDVEDIENVIGGLTETDESNSEMPSELETSQAWLVRQRPCNIDDTCVRAERRVANVRVRFPFDEIMPPQEQIIENTVQAIIRGKHVLIESPTGTGKTMALLCAALAAQHQICLWSGSSPRIIFCTRTHRQVKQVVSQVRKSPYRPWLQIVGSREQGLCIEPDVLQRARDEGVHSSQECRSARAKAEQRARRSVEGRPDVIESRCRYWMPLADPATIARAHHRMRSTGNDTTDSHGLLDIEDLGAIGRELHACPFFLSKVALAEAELVICPYNYVLEPSIASSTKLLDDRSVVIIDEGHNIENHCREAGSCVISEKTLNDIHRRIDEASRYILNFNDGESISLSTIQTLEATMNNIHKLCSDTLDMFFSMPITREDRALDRHTCRIWRSTLEGSPDVLEFIRESGAESGFAVMALHDWMVWPCK